jgi:hypothetical protein
MHLKKFGCRAYVQVPEEHRTKLEPKAWRGIMLGYDELYPKCYRIMDERTGRIKLAVHVAFNEQEMPAKSPQCECGRAVGEGFGGLA